jgi:cellulose synthase/poly-beta-1,6-N-acetylglucosamine synthase-like glycosyltransferase
MQIATSTSPWLIEVCRIIFFGAAGTLLYAWIFYPVVLAILPSRRSWSRVVSEDGPPPEPYPFLSLVIAAYNEEDAIEAKIRNFLESSYPGRSELLIVSDGSTDRTVEIASRYISERVRLFAESINRGKGASLARALPLARGEIVVFSDATSIFSVDALNHLILPFADPAVGLVTGSVKVVGNEVAGLYRRYEDLVEKLEAHGGSISTAHGCIYAIRRSLLHDHDQKLTNDFVQPILVNLQGARVAVASQAACYEPFSPDRTVQFERQVRMVALASLVYFRFLPALLLGKQWRLLFVLTSHKFLRWLTVPMLLAVVLATTVLAGTSPLFSVALGAEILLAATALVGAILTRAGIRSLAGLFWEFIELNFAACVGVARSIAGQVPFRWSTTTRPLPSTDAARARVSR